MIKQNVISSMLKMVTLTVAATFCWVTAVSATMITYDFTGFNRIKDELWDQNQIVHESHFTGSLIVDTDTRITTDCGSLCTGHRYSIEYNLVSNNNDYIFIGGGELYLGQLADTILSLEGNAVYMQTVRQNYIFDPEPVPEDILWHVPDFDIASLKSFDVRYQANNTGPTIFINDREVISADMFLNQVSTSVPEPAIVWLLGSGLIGLIGFARRKKTGSTRNRVGKSLIEVSVTD